MVVRQSITSISGENTSIGLGNILYYSEIDSDLQKIGVLAECIKRIRRKYKALRIMSYILLLAYVIVGVSVYDELHGVLRYLFYVSMVYAVILAIFLIMTKLRLLLPMKYYIYIHEIPARREHKSIVLVSQYYPSGRNVTIIPIDTVDRIGIIRDKKYIRCARSTMEGSEIFITNRNGKEIVRFGFYCDEKQVEKTAAELWEIVRSIKEKEHQ